MGTSRLRLSTDRLSTSGSPRFFHRLCRCFFVRKRLCTAFHVFPTRVSKFLDHPQRGRLALPPQIPLLAMFRCKSLTPVRSTHWAFERRSPLPSPYGIRSPRLLAFMCNAGAALHHRRTQLCSSGLVTSRVPVNDSTLQRRQHRVSFSLRQRSSTLSTLSTLARESLIDDTLVANPTSLSTMSASAPLDTQAAASPGSSHSPLWSPTTNPPNTTRTFAFLRSINSKFQLNLSTYEDLWQWSVEHPSEFWDAVWDETDVLGVKGDAGAVSIYISLCLKLDQGVVRCSPSGPTLLLERRCYQELLYMG